MRKQTLGDIVMKELRQRVHFAQQINQCSDYDLFFHQTNRIYEAIKKKDKAIRQGPSRLLCGDATGAGKTLTAVYIKVMFDEMQGKMGKAIVFAPGQTMGSVWSQETQQTISSVWSQETIDDYLTALHIPKKLQKQEVAIIEKYKDFEKINGNTGFIVINYDKMGMDKDFTKNRYWQRVMELCESVDMTIFDESHRLKNYTTNSAKAFSRIIDKTKDKRAILLTATPCPNRLRDVGFLLYMLNPDKKRFTIYKDQPFIYANDISAIRDVMLSGQWFILPKQAVERIFNLPKIHKPQRPSDFTYVDLSQEEVMAYFNTWRPSAKIGKKLNPLRRILMQSKIRELERIVRSFANEEQQTIVYTALKRGIVGPIKRELEKIYGKGNVCIVDGDTKLSDKLRLANEFRRGKYRAITMTGVISEGINLSCGDKRVDIIITEPTLTHARYDQIIGRLHRDGQRKDVYVHILLGRSPHLEQLMRAEISKLEKEYDVKFRSNWEPTFVDFDSYSIAVSKQMIFEGAIRRALPLPKNVLDLMDVDESTQPKEISRVYKSMVNLKEFEDLARKKAEEQYFGRYINICAPFKGKKYNEKNLLPMVKDYLNKEIWMNSSDAESVRVIVRIIGELEKSHNAKYKGIVDLGSGPGCLGIILNEDSLDKKVDCVDGMSAMIKLGKKFCKGIDTISFYKRYIWDTRLKAHNYDIVTCSNALHDNDQKKDRDIERTIIEANRLLKPDRYFILSIIPTTKETDMRNLGKALERYNFDVEYNNAIQVIGTDEDSGRKRVYKIPIIVGRKTDHTPLELQGDALKIYFPPEHKATGGRRGTYIFSPAKEKQLRKHILVDKQYLTTDGNELSSEVAKWR